MALTPPENQFLIQAKLLRFEDRFGILQHESIGEFRWPIKNLPEEVKVGDLVSVKIASPKLEEETKFESMRKLLEELIN